MGQAHEQNSKHEAGTGDAGLDRLIEALRQPARYPHVVTRVELLQTHISCILLAGDYAYKIKKPVNLGFLDFSTLAARRFYCAEELRLNRRTAPQNAGAADGRARKASRKTVITSPGEMAGGCRGRRI